MTKQPTDIRKHSLRARKPFLTARSLQYVLLLNGIILSLVAFALLDGYIKTIIKHEYDRTSDMAVGKIVNGISGIENALRAAKSALSVAGDQDKYLVIAKIKQDTDGLKGFDHVFWMAKSDLGVWETMHIYSSQDERKNPTALGKKFMESFVVRPFVGDTDLRMETIPSVDAIMSFAHNASIEEQYFVLVGAINPANQNDGYVIGLSHIGNVMGRDWRESIGMFSRVSVRDLATGAVLYNLQGTDAQARTFDRHNQNYDFKIADTSWDIALEFFHQKKFEALENLPYIIAMFGLVLTMLSVLYVGNNEKQSSRLTRINMVLGRKNKQLREEIGKREKLNRSIRKTEKENRAIIDSVSDIIFEIDREAKILFLNNTWTRVTGFESDRFKGHDLFTMLHPDDQKRLFGEFDLLLKGQKQTVRSFTRLRIFDGTFRSVELTLSAMAYDESQKQRFVGSFTDVEERRRAERALGEAEKKYRAIVENAAGGIFQVTPEGLYLSANPAMARILGYDSPDDIVRINALKSVYADKRVRLAFQQQLESNSFVNNHETEVKKRNGDKIWINENARAVRDESGNTLYYEGSVEEITHRKDAETVLREAKMNSDMANRAKSEFLANMSHELRTPLNAIIGFSEIIKNEVFGPIGQRSYWEYARDIHESGQSLLKIINEILEISKIEASDRQLNEKVVDLNKVIKSCLQLLSSKVDLAQMTVKNNIGELPQLVAEEVALKQVLINLLSNALKFTPSAGTITLSSEIDNDGNLRISVTDTGIGLNEEEIAKVLEPFAQADNSLSRDGSGTGLGLSLANALIKLHGGRLELFSQKGIGTTATIILPKERFYKQKPKNPAGQGAAKAPVK